MIPTTSYDGDEPMYESSGDDTDYKYSDSDNNYENSGGGGDGCADIGCLLFFIMIAYALFKFCGCGN